jgi:curli biogenesis system outer membrane secretion channel CsgG
MFRDALVVLLSMGLLVSQLPAQAAKKTAAARKTAPGGISIDQIVQMLKLKLPEAAILSKLTEAKGGLPKASVDDLIKLKEAGASDAVIMALSGSAPAGGAAAPAAAAAKVDAAPPKMATVAGFPANLSSIACAPNMEKRKRVLAVEEFEYGAVQSQIQAIFNTQVDIGKGILALLTKRIQKDGKYRIVERAKINKILGEQDFGASGRVKQGTNAKISKIIGSDAILMGTITVFGRDDKGKTIGGGGFGGGMLGGLKIKLKEDKAVVAISYRLVDAETSEVIDTAEARGESIRKSKSFGGGILGGGGGAAGGVDMTASNFAETIIGEATIATVDQLAASLSKNEEKIPQKQIDVEARVAEVLPPQLYISSGGNDGIKTCDRFEVSRIIKEVRDPTDKNIVLDLVTEKVGDFVVTEVRDRMAIGTFAGTAKPEVGFVVKKVNPPAAN